MTDKAYEPTQQTCDFCHDPIVGESTDMMISTTQYDETHEIKGTMERAPEGIKDDYLVFCTNCTIIVVNAWNNLVDKVGDKS